MSKEKKEIEDTFYISCCSICEGYAYMFKYKNIGRIPVQVVCENCQNNIRIQLMLKNKDVIDTNG